MITLGKFPFCINEGEPAEPAQFVKFNTLEELIEFWYTSATIVLNIDVQLNGMATSLIWDEGSGMYEDGGPNNYYSQNPLTAELFPAFTQGELACLSVLNYGSTWADSAFTYSFSMTLGGAGIYKYGDFYYLSAYAEYRVEVLSSLQATWNPQSFGGSTDYVGDLAWFVNSYIAEWKGNPTFSEGTLNYIDGEGSGITVLNDYIPVGATYWNDGTFATGDLWPV